MPDETQAAQQPTQNPFTNIVPSRQGAALLLQNPNMTPQEFMAYWTQGQQQVDPADQGKLFYDYLSCVHASNALMKAGLANGAGSVQDILKDKKAWKAADDQGGMSHKALFQASEGWRKTALEVLGSETAKNVSTGAVGAGLAAIVGGLMGGKKMILPAALIGGIGLLLARTLFKGQFDQAFTWLQQKLRSGQEAQINEAVNQQAATGMPEAKQLQQQLQASEPWKAHLGAQQTMSSFGVGQQPQPPMAPVGPQQTLAQQYGQPPVVPSQPPPATPPAPATAPAAPVAPAATTGQAAGKPAAPAAAAKPVVQPPPAATEQPGWGQRAFSAVNQFFGGEPAGSAPAPVPAAQSPGERLKQTAGRAAVRPGDLGTLTSSEVAPKGGSLYIPGPSPNEQELFSVNAKLRRLGEKVPEPGAPNVSFKGPPPTAEDRAALERQNIQRDLAKPPPVPTPGTKSMARSPREQEIFNLKARQQALMKKQGGEVTLDNFLLPPGCECLQGKPASKS